MDICEKCGAYLEFRERENNVPYKHCPNCGWEYIFPDMGDKTWD